MRPPYEKGRYITLLGHPIGPQGPKPLATSFYERAEFKAGGIAVALTALFNDAVLNMAQERTVGIVSGIGAGNLVDCFLCPSVEQRFLLGRIFNRHDFSEKCIDTRPDRNTVSTFDRYGLPARMARLKYALLGGVFVCTDTVSSVTKMATGQNPIPSLMISASLYARLYSGYHRFNRVAKGDWVIVDMPEPEKQREGIPALTPAMTQ